MFTIVFNFLFACRHRQKARSWPMGRTAYQVCTDCGARRRYDLEHTPGPWLYASVQTKEKTTIELPLFKSLNSKGQLQNAE